MPDPTAQEPAFKCPFCGHTATFGRGGGKFSCGACGLWSNPDGTPHPYPAPAEAVESNWLCGMCGGTTPHGYPDCLHHKAAPASDREAYQRAGDIASDAAKGYAKQAEESKHKDGPLYTEQCRRGRTALDIAERIYRLRDALATPPVDARQPTAWAVFFNNPGAKPIVETSRLKAEKAFRELGESADRIEPLYTAPPPASKEEGWEPYAGEEVCDVRRQCFSGTTAKWRWLGEEVNCREYACDECKALHEQDYPEKLAQEALREAQSRCIGLAAERIAKQRAEDAAYKKAQGK